MSLPLLKTSARLFLNGLNYRYQKRTGRPGRPQALSLEVTHNCIARCIMCNIWKIPRDEPELSTNDWLELLSADFMSDVRELDITGGEPFLLDDIDTLLSGIGRLRDNNLKKLRSVAVTTNGFLTERVLEKTEIILREFEKKEIDLVMVCALDAVGEIHERIRNVSDAFDRVNNTINGLAALRDRYPNLVTGLKTTILPVNIDELDNISRYAAERGLFSIISPCIITGGRYLNKEKENNLVFSDKDKEKMIRFFKGSGFRWSFHAESLVRYLETGFVRKPCSCGFNYFFIRSSGEVFLCPLISRGIGNIKNEPVESLFGSSEAREFRKNVGDFPECMECTEPGLERYALPFEGFTYLGMLFRYGRREFLELHRHLGLGKYI